MKNYDWFEILHEKLVWDTKRNIKKHEQKNREENGQY